MTSAGTAGHRRAHRRRRAAAAVGVAGPLAASCLLAGPAWASAAPGVADDPAAAALLQRSEDAVARLSWAGTRMSGSWGPSGVSSVLVDVRHDPAGGTWLRPRGGSPDRWVATGPTGPAGDATWAALLLRLYEVRRVAPPSGDAAGGEVVVGRRADVVALSRDGREVARIWLDAATGLPLRRELYDRAGAVVRASAYLSLAAGTATTTGSAAPGTATAAAPDATPAALRRLRAQGWACPELLGERLLLTSARRLSGPAEGTVHLVYTDGLSAVSVFQQRGVLDPAALAGAASSEVAGVAVLRLVGAPTRLVWQRGDTVVTVVADAPDDLVETVVAALSPEPAPDVGGGVLARLGRGWDRVSTWFEAPAGEPPERGRDAVDE